MCRPSIFHNHIFVKSQIEHLVSCNDFICGVFIEGKIIRVMPVKIFHFFNRDGRIIGKKFVIIVIKNSFFQCVTQFLDGLGDNERSAAHAVELSDVVGSKSCIGTINKF